MDQDRTINPKQCIDEVSKTSAKQKPTAKGIETKSNQAVQALLQSRKGMAVKTTGIVAATPPKVNPSIAGKVSAHP